MRLELVIRNRQRARGIAVTFLRRIAGELFESIWPVGDVALGIHLVAHPEMIRLNEHFLGHKGTTDVITFDYGEAPTRRRTTASRAAGGRPARVHGEIFICVPEAEVMARRYHTTWQREVTRYLVHGVLHLSGYDDRRSVARRRMKRVEQRLLTALAGRLTLERLAR